MQLVFRRGARMRHVHSACSLTQGQIRWNTPPLPFMWDYSLAIALTRACTSGEQHAEAVATRLASTLGLPVLSWLSDMAFRYAEQFAPGVRSRERDVLRFIRHDVAWVTKIRTRSPRSRKRVVKEWMTESPQMQAVQAARDWAVPTIETTGALAEWLGIGLSELEWFADAKGLLRKHSATPLHHYHYRVLQKRSGGIRIIEAPQKRLKALQRRILTGILEKVPQYYSAAHGFVKGRSIQTFAAPHQNKQSVVRIDLQDFFPTIGVSRVQAVFRTMGYPETVADGLGSLCTNITPRTVFAQPVVSRDDLDQHIKARNLYSRPHLPQGAPTSPLLANMCAYRLDCRLTALADWAGANYTRYADDLALSGNDDFARNAQRYAAQVSAIAMDEGWSVQHHKTRVMRRGVRQQLAGVIVNAHLNVPRESFDELKAILTNCVRRGATTQNRGAHADFRAHLRGRVAFVSSVNAAKGRRLQAIYERINWE